MKSLMCLLREVLLDRGTWCCVSTTFDLKTIERRVECEGLSFLAITLPSFGADLQKGLDQGKVDRQLFCGFKRSRRTGELPELFSGFLGLIFDAETGRLLDDPSVDAIQAVRQLTLMWSKISITPDMLLTEWGQKMYELREKSAIQKYVECEQEVRKFDQLRTEDMTSQFDRMAGLLWSDALQRVDEDIYYGRLVPKHGPGATADKLLGNQKYNQKEWTSRMEGLFPAGEFLLPSWSYRKELDRVDYLEPGAERPVRVITVPKTLKTPRIIAVEPACMQYTQQAVLESLVGHLEGSDNPYSWLIGFQDQEPNRRMALEGSLYGNLATLDLSEASDRVSNQLVRLLMRRWPHVAEALDVTRSRKADVPGKGVLRLAKFASMGSALCFPVEAMVFATIILCGVEDALNRPLTKGDLNDLRRRVRVYGDDIIVPTNYALNVVGKLEAFGLRVNTDKSFWTGKFRESCGREYYEGHDVSIVRVRSMLPSRRSDVPELLSSVSLRNQLYKAGYWRPTAFLDRLIGDLIPFPRVGDESPVLGRQSFLGYETQRIDPDTHNPLVRGHVVRTKLPPNSLEGPGALLKWYLKRGVDPFEDVHHLERSGRARSIDTKPGWARAY
ncbi:TPA_asm: RNA-directed RNA polymerase [ssRNA phage Gerhypos.4_16]|uniref:RNA-directed RNA polymerase n=2 Tax=Leviviricetes TaxID=2842243 RepID=A0A8S5KZG8_9VIRU|nr:RNA-directed RNA polymerase [ssRNA phage Gerhypos.4_16]QDH89645.1 MAG: RNA-dependent RNA polymerase [Leviviridae sp.]DAD50575.1 TPA_asm: RNA-directed RNA polymerase [ssRNA phage Gerhypos.4_16]